MGLKHELLKLREGGHLGRLTLDSEATLNSLTLEMIESLHSKLRQWEQDPSVKAVWLEGAGSKAFCAGGDIRRLYQSMLDNDDYGSRFFTNEYALDYFIHNYKKPLLVWGSGIVMGGGLGLMAGAGLRLVTETTKIAMPEITIGLFPDVGGSYFLNKMPGKLGLYLGLCGTRLNADDALFVGLGDVKIASEKKSALLEALVTYKWPQTQSKDELCADILKLCETLSGPKTPSILEQVLADVNKILSSAKSAVEIEKSFTKFLAESQHPQLAWFKAGYDTFKKGSPTSACLIVEQLRRTKNLSAKDCFDVELHMAKHILTQHDFREGVRALLIEKDNKPQWKPASIAEVLESDIQRYFSETLVN